VAVLDRAGNLILRIGRYGNADSAGAASRVPLGGDEVGMVHGAYLATITDRRLFVADSASDRIYSVKLGYHATERVALKGVPDAGKAAR
jgi:nucleoside permease NupC